MSRIDKSWIFEENRLSAKYIAGVELFLEIAKNHVNAEGKARCPCKTCVNIFKQTIDVMDLHLFDKGFSKDYTNWIYHGEPRVVATQPVRYVVEDAGGMHDALQDIMDHDAVDEETPIDPSTEYNASQFEDLFTELEAELWPGCTEFSSLSFLVTLMHMKVMNKWTNSSFDQLLQVLKKSHPVGNRIPESHYAAKAILRRLGLGYQTIHVCKHDCALFWKENAELQSCPVCNESRWVKKDGGKKIPHRILRYFPLKDRLKRLYGSRHSALEMRWHQDKRYEEDGILRHPADGAAWKELDKKFPAFAAEPRNVRLGLAADGFNPFGDMSLSYSMWPVVLTAYNLPPWLCMKASYLMLTLLIPGPAAPGKDMDIFLRPLVDELKELWEDGIVIRDGSDGKLFKMHAALLWTVNDFPARSYLSGWSGQGYLACPTCNDETPSLRARSKIVYYDHRRFLPVGHRMRKSKHYKNRTEKRLPPRILSGGDILRQLRFISNRIPGKHIDFGGKKRKRETQELNWMKKSIFFELPYWSELTLRHNLDVMHIEKNVCDNLLGTLLNIEGKSKDTDKARLDLKDLNIKPELHLYMDGNRWMKPQASYTLSNAQCRDFTDFIRSVKFPDGFAGNLKKNVSTADGKLMGLKSHDCHVIMQRLLVPAIRPYLEKNIRVAITELCNFFRLLCAKTLNVNDLKKAQEDVKEILCKLEQIFPPAFFTIMVHLIMHLPDEAIEGGPVHMRWMYPFERYLGSLKRYVKNRARPEGSIAEAYVVEEALTFCSRYMDEIETRFTMPGRTDVASSYDFKERETSVFQSPCRPFGKMTLKTLDEEARKKAEWYIFTNCPEIDQYMT